VEGSTLTVTADAPSDVLPRERWVGQTSFSGGLDLVDQADVVALVSSPTVYGRGQLPAKLIDAMVAGRAIVASDLPPMRWALGKAGVIVDADDTSALVTALQSLRAPELRRELGDRARQRAIDMFSVEVVAARLSEIVEGAMRA
jgi:glycosyltransferase involved in cell wall biosynthesis